MTGPLQEAAPGRSASPSDGCDTPPVQRPPAGRELASLAARLVELLDRHPVPVLLVMTAGYLAATFAVAHSKQLWDDEIFSWRIARSGFHGAWEALKTGADQHPPTFYWLTYLFIKVFGYRHITFRLPEILGFWTMSLGLFWLVSRKTTNLMGCAVALFPLTSHLGFYATEGRGYGLLLGFSAIALCAWQCAASRIRRGLTVPLFGLALVGAICSHYYAVLVFIPFGMGELVRLWHRGRPDWPLWAACCSPIVPMLAFLPVLHSSAKYSAHFWATPSTHAMMDGWGLAFGDATMALLGVLTLAYLYLSIQMSRPAQPRRRLPLAAPHELVVIIGFILIPVFGYIFAKTVTHGLTPRYVAPWAIGFGVLLGGLLHYLSNGSKAFALAALIIMACCAAGKEYGEYSDESGRARMINWTSAEFVKLTPHDFPIAVAEVTIFHKAWYYGDPSLHSHMTYLCDPDMSIKYLGHDTIDRGLMDLKPWFGENVQPYRDFLARTPRFLVYGYIGEWSWLSYALIEDHCRVQLLYREGDHVLFMVSHDPGN